MRKLDVSYKNITDKISLIRYFEGSAKLKMKTNM